MFARDEREKEFYLVNDQDGLSKINLDNHKKQQKWSLIVHLVSCVEISASTVTNILTLAFEKL